ncbi:hypothetical protein ACRYI5_07725 [Furfurilactobacillus sp. WILCCON 0119]|uniref:hypothetical protein n=1 Tax=Furfurilactobacillus entadae TaxID=2922307 RepID=UPI0035EA803E
MNSITTERWLAQLMQIPHGGHFNLTALPVYQAHRHDAPFCRAVAQAFNQWIALTNGAYVRIVTTGYRRC